MLGWRWTVTRGLDRGEMLVRAGDTVLGTHKLCGCGERRVTDPAEGQVDGSEQLGDRLYSPGASPGDMAIRADEHRAAVGEAVAPRQPAGVAHQLATGPEDLERHGCGRRGGPPGLRVWTDDQREPGVEQVQQRAPASPGRHPGVRRPPAGQHAVRMRPGR